MLADREINHTRGLCRIEEIPDGEARGFSVEVDYSSEYIDIFIVRKGTRLYGYINSCPHSHWPLELVEDQFMTLDKKNIQCVNHGAWFEISTGRCLGGPCKGKFLDQYPVTIIDGWIVPT